MGHDCMEDFYNYRKGLLVRMEPRWVRGFPRRRISSGQGRSMVPRFGVAEFRADTRVGNEPLNILAS